MRTRSKKGQFFYLAGCIWKYRSGVLFCSCSIAYFQQPNTSLLPYANFMGRIFISQSGSMAVELAAWIPYESRAKHKPAHYHSPCSSLNKSLQHQHPLKQHCFTILKWLKPFHDMDNIHTDLIFRNPNSNIDQVI